MDGPPDPERAPRAHTAPHGTALKFIVYGEAKPAGSKKAFVNPKTGRAVVTDSSGKAGKDWRAAVTFAAADAMRDAGLAILTGALVVELDFVRPRPAGHYGTGRNADHLKPSAPRYPTTRPDVLKLARGVEDAMTGIVYRDDSQIVVERLAKFYGAPARVEIRILHRP